MAVCLVLLVAAGLLLRGLQAAQTVDPGFSPDGIATAVSTLSCRVTTMLARRRSTAVAARLAARAGNRRSGAAWIRCRERRAARFHRGHARRQGRVQTRSPMPTVSANYFAVLGIPIVRGRGFEAREKSAERQHVCWSQRARRAPSGPVRNRWASVCAYSRAGRVPGDRRGQGHSRHRLGAGGPGLCLSLPRVRGAPRAIRCWCAARAVPA